MLEDSPTQNPLRFFLKRQPKTHSVIEALYYTYHTNLTDLQMADSNYWLIPVSHWPISKWPIAIVGTGKPLADFYEIIESQI